MSKGKMSEIIEYVLITIRSGLIGVRGYECQ